MTPPRSRWGFANPSKGMINYQVKEGQKQQLLQQASSLVPDYSKLTESLMSNEMHAADQMRMKNLLDSVTSQYMDNYNRNPFYSFSRDARNMTRTMYSIVNDPRIKQLGQQYEYDRARWEEGRKDGIITNFDVNENGILVGTPVRDQNGAVTDFRIGRKRNIEKGDVPLTLNDTYQYITKTAGGGYGGFNYNMSTDQQLLNNLDKSFQNIGETKIKQDIIEQGRSIMTSNNRVQINNRVAWLLNQGISNADMNNLYSKYFKETGDFNMDNAKKYAIKYIADYAEGANEAVMESEYFAEVRKRAAGGGGDGSDGSTRQLPIPYVTAFLDGGPKQLSQITTSRGSTVIGEGNVISGIMEGAKDRKIKSLPVLSQLSTAGGFIVNLNDDKERGLRNGDFVNPPNISFEDMVVSDRVDKAPKMLVLPVDNNGRPANVDDAAQVGALLQQEGQVIPQQLRKYFRFATPEDVKNGTAQKPGDPIVNQKYFTQVTVNVPERRWATLGVTSVKDRETDEALRSYGHIPFDDTRLRESYNAGSGADLSAPLIGFNDRVYEVDLFIPTDNTEPFMQDKVRGTTDALLLGDSSRLRDPSRPVSRAHLGLEPFNMVRNRTKYPTFPGK